MGKDDVQVHSWIVEHRPTSSVSGLQKYYQGQWTLGILPMKTYNEFMDNVSAQL